MHTRRRGGLAISILLGLFLVAATATASRAHGGGYHGGGYHGGGYWHGGSHWHGSVFIGPWWWGGSYYYPYGYPYGPSPYAWYYTPPYYYYPYAVPPSYYPSDQPQSYVQQAPEPSPPQAYWYYCPSSRAYYPQVRTCSEQWVKVPPR